MDSSQIVILWRVALTPLTRVLQRLKRGLVTLLTVGSIEEMVQLSAWEE